MTTEAVVVEGTELVHYTEDQIGLIHDKIRALRASGNPQPAFIMRDKLRAGELIQPHEYGEDVIKPEVSTAGVNVSKLIIPNRNGSGSSTKAWRSFAKVTLEMDHKVIEKMSRADLVALLEEQGVIQKEAEPQVTTEEEEDL